jgi:hypothetical protein
MNAFAWGLEGLLPPRVESLQAQATRVVEYVREKTSRLERYRYLSALRADNITLFYRVVLNHLEGRCAMGRRSRLLHEASASPS